MFDILLYLFENYPQIESTPDRDTLAIKLNAAGFQLSEIEQVLDWLGELDGIHGDDYPSSLAGGRDALRCFSSDEQLRLGVEEQSFLLFLQQSGIIDDLQREWIIDRVMALDEDDNIAEKIRWITLVVLWSHHPDQNFLLLEDMLFNQNAAPTLH
ncbi:MAG: DUF494 domain-containing protein [Betaproteobacteria bacterium]|nr:DUF494 domain-containing protein [Betaproteobacteria bacterium]